MYVIFACSTSSYGKKDGTKGKSPEPEPRQRSVLDMLGEDTKKDKDYLKKGQGDKKKGTVLKHCFFYSNEMMMF